MYDLFVTFVILLTGNSNCLEFRLGMLSPFKHPRLGWENNAAAATIAIEKAQSEGLLPGHNVSVLWRDDNCNALGGAGNTVLLHDVDDVDVIIGPPCSASTTPSGLLATFWNMPIFSQASSDPILADKSVYRTLVRLGPPFNKLGNAFVEIFNYFNWRRIVMVSRRKTDNKKVFCDYSSRSVEESFRGSNITLADWIQIDDNLSYDVIDGLLDRIKQRGRIVILCSENSEDKRRILLRASDKGMMDGSYVYFTPDHLPPANVRSPWIRLDDFNAKAKTAFTHIFQITVAEMAGKGVEDFRDLVAQKMEDPPWNYNYTLVSGQRGSEYSPFLHDTVYLYLLILNETVYEGSDYRNGTLMFNKATGRTFKELPRTHSNTATTKIDKLYKYINITDCKIPAFGRAMNPTVEMRSSAMVKLNLGSFKYEKSKGITGNVQVDSNGDREPDYWIWDLKPDGSEFEVVIAARMTSNNAQKIHLLQPIIWETSDGLPPRDTPVCGFMDESCPEDTSRRVIYITVAVVLAFGFLVGSIFGYLMFRHTKFQKQLELQLWKVKYEDIQFSKSRALGSISQLSICTNSTLNLTGTGTLSETSSGNIDLQVFSLIGIYRGTIVTIRSFDRGGILLNREDHLELEMLRDIRNENVNTFIGLCVDEKNPCILTSYCSKGSIQDILENDDIKLDWMFKISMITDLIKGIEYLHNSPLKLHGNLKSSNCVVDNRWVLKVTDFGILRLRKRHQKVAPSEYQFYKGLLWTAPEHICQTNMYIGCSQKADIYSLGIILFEILYRTFPYDTKHISPREIIERVKACESPSYRPTVAHQDMIKGQSRMERTESFDHISSTMENCWMQDPELRPTVSKLKRQITQLDIGRKTNIVDNMISMLEKYSNNLEELVEQRTAELMEEKKKTDILLYRMLPPSVAERLKSGEMVQPEIFSSVTIYFSDIVGFTSLCSESSAIDVVDFLNDLYTDFDAIISQHDVYKVETIGDAYMVASGLPIRNGDRHATEIANMALDLQDSVLKFKIKHKPNRKLKLRIGLHTGPCAAGVVGRTMPRYCLFGDTVNMASRMESNGEALKIHLSEETKSVLESSGLFNLALRGDIEIKGKGQKRTYWLIGKINKEFELSARGMSNCLNDSLLCDKASFSGGSPTLPPPDV